MAVWLKDGQRHKLLLLNQIDAEPIGASVGGNEALGYANMMAELGMHIEGVIHMETYASAAIGVA